MAAHNGYKRGNKWWERLFSKPPKGLSGQSLLKGQFPLVAFPLNEHFLSWILVESETAPVRERGLNTGEPVTSPHLRELSSHPSSASSSLGQGTLPILCLSFSTVFSQEVLTGFIS